MKKLIIFTLLALVACNPVTEVKKEPRKNRKKETKYTGSVKKEANGNQGAVDIKYKDGLKHGLSKEYYPDGKLRKETPYANGKIHGSAKIYHKNGNLKRKTAYAEGKKNGVQTFYFKSGNPKATLEYDQDLVLPGIKEIDFTKKTVKQPKIQVKHEDLLIKDQYNLYFYLEKNGKRVAAEEVYILENKNDWNSSNKERSKLKLASVKQSGRKEYLLPFTIEKGYYLIKDFYVFAVYKSHYGHEAVVYKKVNFAAENS